MPNDIPSWLKNGCPPMDQANEQLISSREEMFKALELYHTHVKHVIAILFSLLTALFAVLGFSSKLESDLLSKHQIINLVAVFLITIFPIAIIAIGILKRYYEVYVSSLIFAVRLHLAVDWHRVHPWFDRTIEQARKWTSVASDEDFLNRRTNSPKDTFFCYACIIRLLSVLSLISGIWLLAV